VSPALGGPIAPFFRFPGPQQRLPETCRKLSVNSDGLYQATGTPKSFEHKKRPTSEMGLGCV